MLGHRLNISSRLGLLYRATCSRRFMESKASTESENQKRRTEDNILLRFIKDKIRVEGPLTVAHYMELCTSAPNVGYYTARERKRPVFGEEGDFVTSPEISQMIGELTAVWVCFEMSQMGHRRPWQLVELGPGRGFLTQDILRTLKRLNATQFLSVHLVEISPALTDEQEKVLCGNNKGEEGTNETKWSKRNFSTVGCPVYWYKQLMDVPEKFSFIVAHEFFDALPVHQFCRVNDDVWRELFVDWDGKSGKLIFKLANSDSLALKAFLTDAIRQSPSHDVFEVSSKSGLFINQIRDRIVGFGGGGLIVDYGHEGDRGTSSLRAYSKHKIVDFLSNPGRVDLTADVNFAYLKELVQDDMCIFGPIAQREFLHNLGIEVRLKRLLESAKSDKDREYLQRSYDMITAPDQMGNKFKVMAMFPKVLSEIFDIRKQPAGFCSI